MMRDICLILPEQEIKDGVVTMRVLIGHYDRAAFENASELYTSRAIDFVPAARPGKQILRKPLDRELLILNDIPGVRAHAYLSPGRTTGTAFLSSIRRRRRAAPYTSIIMAAAIQADGGSVAHITATTSVMWGIS